MRTLAILPVKRFELAKTRLGEQLGPAQRRRLAQAMVSDVLDALVATGGLDAVVVTNEQAVASLARDRGAAVLADPAEAGAGPLVMRVRRFAAGATPGGDPDGVVPVARFAVDGVILGDGRNWDEVRFDRVDDATLPLLAGTGGVAEQIVVGVDPLIEDLIGSVLTVGE